MSPVPKKFFPIKITDEAMEHIHCHAGRGHITVGEISDVIRSEKSIPYRNKKEGKADYVISGQAVSEKKAPGLC